MSAFRARWARFGLSLSSRYSSTGLCLPADLIALSPASLTYNQPLAPLIVTPWYGGSHGGVAVATESLVHALIDRGSNCAVMRLAPDGFLPRVSQGRRGEEIVDACVRHEAMSIGSVVERAGYHARRFSVGRIMRRLIAAHDIRIAHFHFFATEFEVLMHIARDAGLGVVTTFHGADVNERLVNPATRPTVETMVRLSDQIIVVSRTLQERLIQAIPDVADRVSLIPNVVPTSFAHATVDEERSTTPRWDVLLVGQLIQRKGGDVLLKAMSRVIDHVSAVRVAFAGTGDLESQLRAQARELGLESHVDFLGELSRDATLDAYRNSRVVAIPSRSEGLPLVLLEAQWLGIPVVASAVDGLPESIVDGEDGLLVPPDDPDSLACAITRLLTDDAYYCAISARARSRARQTFAPQVMVGSVAQIYKKADRSRATMPSSA